MNESVCQFGEHSLLSGIFCQGQGAPADAPVVVFLSAGLVHRVGPFRLYVHAARMLAAAGVSSLRFDLSGIGDSENSRLAAGVEARTAADIRAAYDYLSAEHGAERFIIGGLCSAADDAFRVALDDERVVGVFQFDGMGYRTKKYYRGHLVNHYLPRIASVQKWKQLAGRIVSNNEDSGEDVPHAARMFGEEDDLERSMPTLAQATQGLAAMEERGLKSLLVYSGGSSSYYNYAGQIFDAIPAARDYRHVTEAFYPEVDHSMMLRRDRDRVLGALRDWVAAHWQAAA